MNFTPKSKEELAMDGLLPAGKYPFSVIKAEEKTSKASGNPMLALQLTVYANNGGQVTVFDYLMENKPAQLEQFCRFTGLEALYASGKLEESDCVGREGWVCIKIQPGQGWLRSEERGELLLPQTGGDGGRRSCWSAGGYPKRIG